MTGKSGGFGLRVSLFALLSVFATCLVVSAFSRDAFGASAIPASRIVVRYHEGTFEVVSSVPLNKTLAPTDSLPAKGQASGFWYELRSADGELRYRRVVADPTRLVYEGPVVTESGAVVTERAEAAARDRVFSVLVPRIAPGDALIFYGSLPDHQERTSGEASQAIARLALSPSPDVKNEKKEEGR